MADTIQFRRGAAAEIPRLADGEPGWCRDTKELYIGSPSGNVKAMDASLIATVEQHSKTIAQHETTISQQAQALTQHAQAITQHGQAINELNNELDSKLSASAAAAQAELEAEAELAAVVERFNKLLSAMKISGLMES